MIILMSTLNCTPVIVRDEIIQDIVTKQPVIMMKGAVQNTHLPTTADSQTINQITFRVNPPGGLNDIVNRSVKLKSTIGLRIQIPANSVENNKLCFQYGESEALSAFPTNSLITTANYTINGVGRSVNTQSLMGMMLKQYDQDDFEGNNCPTMQDQKMAEFSDMVLTQSNPLASYLASKGNNVPRGAHPLRSFKIQKYINGVADAVATEISTSDQVKTASTCTTQATNSWVIDLVYTTVEPLLFIEPLLWSKSTNNAGIYGIQTLSLTLTLDPTASRAFSSATRSIPMTVSLQSVSECELLMNYLTAHETETIVNRNSVPCKSYEPRYNTVTGVSGVAGLTPTNKRTCDAHVLSSIPNKIYICVRKLMSELTVKDSDSFLAITGLAVNFNGTPNLLASHTPYDLYKMSKRNGSKQSIYDFLGQASVIGGTTKPTIGSIVIIDPALDLGLPEKYAPGVMQKLNVQTTVSYANYRTEAMANIEVLTVYEYDGVFTTENGRGAIEEAMFSSIHVAEATVKQFGESRQRIVDETSSHSLINVPLLNLDKSDIKTGSGVKSGGSFTESAMARIH
jgi:hypothetical protein